MHGENTLPLLADIEVEKSVIGICLADPDSVDEIVSQLQPHDFYLEAHQRIFEAIHTLSDRRQHVDALTVSDMVGDALRTALMEIALDHFTSLFTQDHIGIIQKYSTKRRLAHAANKIVEIAYDSEKDAEQSIDATERIVLDAASQNRSRSIQTTGTTLSAVMERIDLLMRGEISPGIPTGWASLDMYLSGWQRGNVITVAGRPGMGKSGFVINAADFMTRTLGLNVLFFSLEMSKEEITQRQLSALSQVPLTRIRGGQIDDTDLMVLNEAANEIYKTNFMVEDFGMQGAQVSSATVEHIRRYARRKHMEVGLDCIIIDYLQLMDYDGRAGNRVNEVSHMTRQIKLMSRELNIPVIQLSQLSRAVEQRADKRPSLADLRDSGSIEQDSDAVIFLYRDDYYNPETDMPNVTEAIVAKHRHGNTGVAKLYFQGEFTKFCDLEIARTEL